MGLLRNRGLTDGEKSRIPPGQHNVRDFPVLHVGDVPYREVPPDWDLRVYGRVASPLRLDYAELRALPSATVTCDIHCVTSWSKLDTCWEGVSMSWLLKAVDPQPSASHVIAHAEQGYTANVPIEALHDPNAMLAYRYEDGELEPEHGGPLRLLLPRLYLWKSAKWLRALEFVDRDDPGYWERLGYSSTADPFKEERYGF